jgi:hypothetical protein
VTSLTLDPNFFNPDEPAGPILIHGFLNHKDTKTPSARKQRVFVLFVPFVVDEAMVATTAWF